MAPSQLIGAVVLSLVVASLSQVEINCSTSCCWHVGASVRLLQSRPPGEPVVAGLNSEEVQELSGELP
eukprot:scaffold81615_cov57-Phaeocystis_antarctica.AAC.1